MPPTIRPAAEPDLPTILRMLAVLTADHTRYDAARFAPPADPRAVYGAWLAESLKPETDVLAILALIEEKPAGYLIAEAFTADERYWSPPCLYIHDIYADPAFRGAGLGSSLVAHAQAWAAARGLTQLRGLVAQTNPHGNAFFARLGFRPATTEFVLDV